MFASGDPRDLPSFPTRRSSDLVRGLTLTCHRAVDAMVEPSNRLEARSEEHTSELQSRGHVVCRLLLEKKKNRPPRSTAKVTYTPIQDTSSDGSDREERRAADKS